MVSAEQCDELLSVRYNDLFRTNVWWPFNFNKLADCMTVSLTQPVHMRFFSMGFLKSEVYETKPGDLVELNTKIRQYVAPIPKTVLAKVYEILFCDFVLV